MPSPPPDVVDALDDADDETLQAVIDYCQRELARSDAEDEPERSNEPPEEFEGSPEQWATAVEDCEAPGRATLTTKTINDNQYLYWQWSEDGATKSEYICPKA